MTPPGDGGGTARYRCVILAPNVSIQWGADRYSTTDPFETNDPCAFTAFVDRVRRAAKAANAGERTLDYDEQYAAAARACARSRVGSVSDKAVVTAIDWSEMDGTTLYDPAAAASDAPARDGDPGGEETGETLGGDGDDAGVQIDPPPDAKDLPDFLKDAVGNATVEEVRAQYEELKAKGLSDDDIEKLYEQNHPEPGEPHGEHSKPGSGGGLAAGDPVLLATGQFELRVTDVDVPSAGFPLRFERVYRSGPAFFGPWGFNWDHAHNQYVRLLNDGGVAHWTGDLREHVYAPRADGGFDPPVGVPRRLTVERDSLGVDLRWLLEGAEGWRWEFARPDGWPLADRVPLVSVSDRHGTSHTLTYDAQGRLAAVRDAWGRGVRLEYGNCDFLERVVDHTGRRWTYWHDPAAELLVSVRTPPVEGSPDGAETRYEYADPERMPPRVRGMLWVTDADGRVVVENEYGGPDDPESRGRVVRQYLKGSETRYAYETVQFVPAVPEAINLPARQTEVQREGEGLRVYVFNFRGDVLEERLRLVADRTWRALVYSTRYDANGNLAEHWDPDGAGLLRVCDAADDDPRARGQPREVWRVASPLAPAPSRRVWAATYEPVHRLLKTAVDEGGATTTLAYDHETSPTGTGALVAVTHPLVTLADGTTQAAVERFVVDARGRWVEHRAAEGARHTRRYFDSSATDGSDGAAGLLTEETLDADGTPRTRAYAYDALGRVASVTDELGRVTSYAHDALGRLLTIALPPVGGTAAEHRFRYDATGHLLAEEHPRGAYEDVAIAGTHIPTRHEYDAWGRRVATTVGGDSPSARRWTWTWDAEDRLVRSVDPLGRVDHFRYDERGGMLESIVARGTPEERSTRFRYDRVGRLRFSDQPFGSTEHRYDGWGRLREVVTPSGTTTRYEYGAGDRLARELVLDDAGTPSEALLSDTRYAYDARGRRQRTERPGASAPLIVRVIHDGEGRPVRTIGPWGEETVRRYDGAGLLVELVAPNGDRTSWEHDARGNLLAARRQEVADDGDVTTSAVKLAYDARDRVVSVTDPLDNVSTFEYDDRGLCVRQRDPAGRATTSTYGLAGEQLTASRERGDGTSATATLLRDARGRLVGRVDPTGAVTSRRLDPLDRVREVTWPDGTATRWEYHRDGHLLAVAYADGARCEQGVDVAARAQTWTTTAPASPTVEPLPPLTRRLDGLGRVVRAEKAGSLVERAYDAAGRLVREARDGVAVTVEYDDAAHALTRGLPSGRADRTRFDAAGRVRDIAVVAPGSSSGLAPGALVARYEYAGGGRIAARLAGNGVTTRFTHDAAARLASVAHLAPGGALLAGRWYVSDALGRRRLVAGAADGADARWSEYDGLGRLTEVRRGVAAASPVVPSTQAEADAYLAAVSAASFTAAERFVVDDLDTLRRRESLDATAAVVDATDLAVDAAGVLVAVDGAAVEHDARGTVIADAERRFVHDAAGRLVRVERRSDDAVLLEQTWDALGRVATRRADGEAWDHYYFGDGLAARESLTQPGLWCDAVAGASAGELVSVSSGGADHWLHHDAVRSLLLATDSAGAPAAEFDYSAFGIPTGTSSGALPPGVRPTFGGHPYARDAALYLAPARAYEPRWGQFLQRDPAGSRDSAGPYVYAAGDPVGAFDPTGAALPEPGSTGGGGGGHGDTPGGAKHGGGYATHAPDHELAWYEKGVLMVAGAVGAVATPFIEAGKQLHDFGAMGYYMLAKWNGENPDDPEMWSGVAAMSAQGMGTGDILKGMGKAIIETPKRLWTAIENRDYKGIGAESVNLYMAVDGAVKLSSSAVKLGTGIVGRLKGASAAADAAGGAGATLAELNAQADAMNLNQVASGVAGERGIGVVYVDRGAFTPAEMAVIEASVRDMDFQAGFAGGLRRTAVPKGGVLRRTGNAAARFARKVLGLEGRDVHAGHIPDIAAGGSPHGPFIGQPANFNSPMGLGWLRYGEGFVFDGFSLLDPVTGEGIYYSAGLEHVPPPLPAP